MSNYDSAIYNGFFTVTVHRARKLRRVSMLKMDPYCVVSLGDMKQKNHRCRHGHQDPIWNDGQFEFPVRQYKGNDVFRLIVMNHELVSDDEIGEFTVPLSRLVQHLGRKWIRLIHTDHPEKVCGEVDISFDWKGDPQGIFDIDPLRGPTTKLREGTRMAERFAPNESFSIFSRDGIFSLQPARALNASSGDIYCKLVWSKHPNDNHFYIDFHSNLRHRTSNGFVELLDIYNDPVSDQPEFPIYDSGTDIYVKLHSNGKECGMKSQFFWCDPVRDQDKGVLKHRRSDMGIGFKFQPFTDPAAVTIPAVSSMPNAVYAVNANNDGEYKESAGNEGFVALPSLWSAPFQMPQPVVVMVPSLIRSPTPFRIVDCQSGAVLTLDSGSRLHLSHDADAMNDSSSKFHWFLTHLRHMNTGLTLFSGENGEIFLDPLQSMAGKLLNIELELVSSSQSQSQSQLQNSMQIPYGLGRGYLRVIVNNELLYINLTVAEGEKTSMKLVNSTQRTSVFDLQPIEIKDSHDVATTGTGTVTVTGTAANDTNTPSEDEKRRIQLNLKLNPTSSNHDSKPFYLKCVSTGYLLACGSPIKRTGTGTGTGNGKQSKCRDRDIYWVERHYDAMQFVFKGPRIEQAYGQLALSTYEVEGQRRLILVPKDNLARSSSGETSTTTSDENSWFEFTHNHLLKRLTEESYANLQRGRVVFIIESADTAEQFQLFRM